MLLQNNTSMRAKAVYELLMAQLSIFHCGMCIFIGNKQIMFPDNIQHNVHIICFQRYTLSRYIVSTNNARK